MAETSELLRNVAKAGRELSVGFDVHLKDLNLTTARARVLLLLLPSTEGVSQAAVTEHLRVEHPTAVRILDGLESLGYTHRVPSPDDRRARMIVLTPQGRAVAKKVSAIVSCLNDHLMSQLDPAEAEIANRVLLQLLDGLQRMKSDIAGSLTKDREHAPS
ncbi:MULTISPECIES: MarR family transcriptional regulator [unclassified Devosia]|uniref:MarR family winged helix-turn-helix transcriptional regulator n=1 Tax=unclassified Devosia TaxID=196773 RepID=UPI001556B2BD|nr:MULTISPECIES: MarR family transcriptional regulator [unclassified Devosia]